MVEPVSMAGGPGRADRSEGDGDERSALAIRLLELCGFSAEKQLVLSYRQGGHSHLAVVRKDTGAIEEIETPYTEISYLRAEASRVVFLGGSPTEFSSVVTLDLMTRKIEVLRRARDVQLDAGYVSAAEPIAFPTENGLTAYGFFYPPKNRDYTGPEGEQPPLIVMSHGGPTAAADSGLNLGVQYWTSRRFAVLDVNYGGSTGFGRAYRRRLDGQWGIVDVDDCVNGARYLVDRNRVHGERLAIRGRERGRFHDARGAHLPGCLQGRRQPLRSERSGGPG